MWTILGVFVLAALIWGGMYLIGNLLVGGGESPFMRSQVNESGPRLPFKVLHHYEDYGTDGKCYHVYEVQATSDEISRYGRGWTIQGDASVMFTHIGVNEWEIRVMGWAK